MSANTVDKDRAGMGLLCISDSSCISLAMVSRAAVRPGLSPSWNMGSKMDLNSSLIPAPRDRARRLTQGNMGGSDWLYVRFGRLRRGVYSEWWAGGR